MSPRMPRLTGTSARPAKTSRWSAKHAPSSPDCPSDTGANADRATCIPPQAGTGHHASVNRPLIREPEFRALLGARLTTALASSALVTVVAFQTYDITRDPLSLGWLGLVEAIPALSLVLFGGHLADRRDRRGIVPASGLPA